MKEDLEYSGPMPVIFRFGLPLNYYIAVYLPKIQLI